MADPIAIIGSGMAAYTLAREFRKRDQETALQIITADDGSSYSKPMLSNALDKDKTPDALIMGSAEKMASDLNATIWTSTWVQKIDADTHQLDTDKGTVRYSKLVLAIGADPIALPIEGNAADQIISVNDLQDYRVFRDRIQEARDVLIIGAGLIGCEFANDLVSANISANVVDLADQPLGRLLPTSAGKSLENRLTELGIRFHLGTVVSRVDRTDGRFSVTLKDGTELETDVVLSAVGLRARTKLAEDAGLKVNRGIQVSRTLQTSHPDIFALGDCAEVEDLVLPFVMPLMNSARALAATLAGEETAVSYPAMPVVVKTPAYPIVVCPPPRKTDGEWIEETTENGIRALYKDSNGKLLGFALLGDAVAEKMALSKELDAWLG